MARFYRRAHHQQPTERCRIYATMAPQGNSNIAKKSADEQGEVSGHDGATIRASPLLCWAARPLNTKERRAAGDSCIGVSAGALNSESWYRALIVDGTWPSARTSDLEASTPDSGTLEPAVVPHVPRWRTLQHQNHLKIPENDSVATVQHCAFTAVLQGG